MNNLHIKLPFKQMPRNRSDVWMFEIVLYSSTLKYTRPRLFSYTFLIDTEH